MTRIAAVDGGTYFHHRTLCEAPFKDCFDDILYVRDVPFTDLSPFDVVVLPCRLNTHLLAPMADQLTAYMTGGGTLLVMGEVFPERFLKGITFTPCETNFWWWVEGLPGPAPRLARPDHPLLGALSEKDCIWHLHGHFAPSDTQDVLIEDDHGALLIEDTTTYAPGRLIAMTLDPCYHHGSHFMPATTAFLSGFLPALRNIG